MVYSSSSDGAGIVEDIDFLVSTNSSTYPIADKTRNVNRALDEAVSLILGADGRWQWDDTNETTLPIGTADLVSGQQDYSFQSDYIVIQRVEIMDSAGNWITLRPLDFADYPTEEGSTAFSDLYSTNATPIYYDKIGNSIMLYPAPNYNSTAGLKAYFQRTPNYFLTSDTTKSPGIAPHLHRFLSLSAAYDFAVAKELGPKEEKYKRDKLEYAEKIKDFYAYRPKDKVKRMTVAEGQADFNRNYK